MRTHAYQKLSLFILVFVCINTFGQSPTADALVIAVGGSPQYTRDNAQPETITVGLKLVMGDKIQTDASSSVSLVFSNGSNITIRPNTTALIQELSQDPFEGQTSYGALEREPSRSRTRVHLDQGEVLGEVRGLSSESVFEITSEIGTAGIRGTIYNVKVERIGNSFRMTVSNVEGSIVASSESLSIPGNIVGDQEEVVIEATYNDETGEFEIVSTTTQPIPEATVTSLRSEAKTITQAATSDQSNQSGNQNNSSTQKQNNNKSNSNNQNNDSGNSERNDTDTELSESRTVTPT